MKKSSTSLCIICLIQLINFNLKNNFFYAKASLMDITQHMYTLGGQRNMNQWEQQYFFHSLVEFSTNMYTVMETNYFCRLVPYNQNVSLQVK